MPKRCFFCPDHTAELADISFGDAWLQEIKQVDSQGTSLMVTRTSSGSKILLEAAQAGFLDISKSRIGDVVRSQYFELSFHKLSFATRCTVAKALGVEMPMISVENVYERSVFTTFFSFMLLATQIAYGRLRKMGISERLPKPLVRVCGIFHFLLGMTDFKLAIREKKV